MPERIELGSVTTVDGRSVPEHVELLSPALWERVQWIAGALMASVFVWAISLAGGWLRVDGWLVSVRRAPRGAEHLLWSLPVLLALVCLAMAVSGVRVSIDARRLGIFGVWPRAYRRTFDLARLRRAAFDLERSASGTRRYRMRFEFSEATVTLHTRDQRTWEALRARFRDRLGR